MNVTIIYGSMDKTKTYNCVQLLLSQLRLNINISVKEFYLPHSSFYHGYFSYYKNSVKIYHTNINSVEKSILTSDLIIFASPVFTCDISSEMKTFLNKLSICITNNVFDPMLMRNKIGIAISITAGAGPFSVTKTLKRNLNFLGINHIFKFSKSLYETNWGDMNLKTKEQIDKKILKLSHKIVNLHNNLHTIDSPVLNEVTSQKINSTFNDNYNIINLNSWKKEGYYHSRRI